MVDCYVLCYYPLNDRRLLYRNVNAEDKMVGEDF
jgi:hypothetical protein